MKLKEIAIDVMNPPHIKKEEEGNIKLISGSSIKGLTVDLDEHGLGNTDKDIEKYKVVDGDILFLAKGNRFGAGVVEGIEEGMLPNQLFFIVRIDQNKYNPKYITWYLKSKKVMAYFDKFTSASVIKSVNKKILGDVEIPIPDKGKQDKFVELLENFEAEKKNTLKYLEQKEDLINEKILSVLEDGEGLC